MCGNRSSENTLLHYLSNCVCDVEIIIITVRLCMALALFCIGLNSFCMNINSIISVITDNSVSTKMKIHFFRQSYPDIKLIM